MDIIFNTELMIFHIYFFNFENFNILLSILLKSNSEKTFGKFISQFLHI